MAVLSTAAAVSQLQPASAATVVPHAWYVLINRNIGKVEGQNQCPLIVEANFTC